MPRYHPDIFSRLEVRLQFEKWIGCDKGQGQQSEQWSSCFLSIPENQSKIQFWKEDGCPLPNSFEIASKRILSASKLKIEDECLGSTVWSFNIKVKTKKYGIIPWFKQLSLKHLPQNNRTMLVHQFLKIQLKK